MPLRTSRRRRGAVIGAGLALAMVVAACGQKPGVHDESASGLPEIIIETGASGAVAGDGVAVDGTAVEGASTEGGRAASGGGGETAAASGEGAAGGEDAAAGGGGSMSLSGSDRTGVSDDAITLGIHAPVTGAAPLPTTSFAKSGDLYWRWVTEMKGEKVLGRSKVNVLFKDDKYAPNTAIQACRELAQSAFILVGGGGTDQIQACGQFAEQAGVPYLSAGVTEAGLRRLQHYFASSMSYPQQTQLLAQYVKKTFPGKKVGAIITDTPNFDDAAKAWDAAAKQHGLDYFKTMRHPKGNTSWITAFARDMQGAGVEVLFILSSPSDYIQFAQQASGQDYKPQYVGVGISKGLNAVLNSGCPHVDKGIFFSPFPGLDWARQNVPEFFEAGQKLGAPTDDIALALWGLASVQHEAFKRYEQAFGSTDLTREDFVKMLERQQGLGSKVNPQLAFSPEDHFGAKQVHVLQADCSGPKPWEHKTLATFASGF